MNLTLIGSLLVTGLLGSAHCVAMCGGAATAMGASSGGSHRLLWVHAGRVLGYATLGAIAAASGSALFESMKLSQMVRPLWFLANMTAIGTGLSLLFLARQPRWLDVLGGRLNSLLRPRQLASYPLTYQPRGQQRTAPSVGKLLTLGAAWATLPCGFLYSALLLVMVSADPLTGAAAMAGFAAATALPLLALQWTRAAVLSSPNRQLGPRWQKIGARLLGALILMAGAYAATSLFGAGNGRLFCT